MKQWSVVVKGVGHIGYVTEATEELARCAALAVFGDEGNRIADEKVIRDDDSFFVVCK